MPTLSQLKNDILHNPIADAEVKHIKGQRVGRRWQALYVLTVLTVFAPMLTANDPGFRARLDTTVTILILFNLIALIAVEWRAVNLIYHSIAREITGHTWESLILTHVDTWKIVLGKWSGVVRGVLPDFVFLTGLRITTLFWIIMDISVRRTYVEYNQKTLARLTNVPMDFHQLLTGSLVIAFYLILELLLITAISLPFSLSKYRRKRAMVIPFVLRIVVPMIWGFAIFLLFRVLPIYFEGSFSLFVGFTASLSDNGLLLVSALTGMDRALQNSPMFVIPGMILGTILMMLIIIASLWFSTLVAHRQNVSKPGFIPKPKPKRQPTS